MTTDTDTIARAAARLIAVGRATSIDEAIHRVMDGMPPGSRPPGHGRVRQHLQGMSMQRLGLEPYKDRQRAVLESIEELLSVFVDLANDVEPIVVGRAARRLFDGPMTVHIRLYTDMPMQEIIELLEMHDTVIVSTSTVDTRHGQLNRITVELDESIDVALTRCPMSIHHEMSRHLLTGAAIETATVRDVRRWLGDAS